MGLFSKKKPKILGDKKNSFDGWVKCEKCLELVHQHEIDDNVSICPKCNFHYRISTKKRLDLLLDKASFKELFANIESKDPLKFVDTEKYKDRIKKAQKKTGQKEAFVCGTGSMNKQSVAIGVFEFSFMGGSMGSVVG